MDVSDGRGFEDLLASIQRTMGPQTDVSMHHDLRWLREVSLAAGNSLRVFVLVRDDVVVGYAPFFLHPVELRYRLGQVTIFSVPVRRAVLEGGPVIVRRFAEPEAEACVIELFRAVRSAIEPDDVVFLAGIEAESELFRLVSRSRQLRTYFHVVPHGKLYCRRFATLQGDYDHYLKTLGPRSRKDLRRTRKRFVRQFGERYRVRIYKSEGDVDLLVADAKKVYQRTYQRDLVGEPVEPGGTLEARLRAAAKYGRLLSYVLYVDREPVAFQIGYQFGTDYHAYQTGYDPAWAKHEPGKFLLTEMFIDLSRRPQVRQFDFLIGDSFEKRRFSNQSRRERLFYLFPTGPRGAMRAYSMRAVDTTSETIGRMADALGVKHIIRQTLRRRSMRKRIRE